MTMRYAHLAPAYAAKAVDTLCAIRSEKRMGTKAGTSTLKLVNK